MVIVCGTSQTLLIKVVSADATGDEERGQDVNQLPSSWANYDRSNPGSIISFPHISALESIPL